MYKESLSFRHIRHMDFVLTLTFDFLILSPSANGMTNDLTLTDLYDPYDLYDIFLNHVQVWNNWLW
jgi:hypothetical protein